MKSNGIVYAAVGNKFLQEAIISATSLKKYEPDIHITIFTNEKFANKTFDNVIQIINPDNWRNGKLYAFKHTPYNRTIFLDTDTVICNRFSEIFSLLDRFDMAACMSELYGQLIYNYSELSHLGDSFPEINSGVVAFKKSKSWDSFLDDWIKIYQSQRTYNIQKRILKTADQPSFRLALYKSDLKYHILPPTYNTRFFGGFISGKVKIIHGRFWNFEIAQHLLNQSSKPRAFIVSKENIKILEYIEKSYGYKKMKVLQYFTLLRHEGISAFISAIINMIKNKIR
jgi:hypothetical protein